MDEVLLGGIDGYELFHGSNARAWVELVEERYEEYDHKGRLLPFELSPNNSSVDDFPCLLIRRSQSQSPTRCRLISIEPIRTMDPKVAKFLIELYTRSGELLIGMIIARKKVQES